VREEGAATAEKTDKYFHVFPASFANGSAASAVKPLGTAGTPRN